MSPNESGLAATAILFVFGFLDEGRFESFGFGGCALINFDHLGGDVCEELINVLSCFGRCLHELDTVFLCWRLRQNYLRLGLLGGWLRVWNSYRLCFQRAYRRLFGWRYYVIARVLIHFIVPMGDVFETLVISDVVNYDNAMSPSIVAVSDCTKSLLSRSVPLC